MTLSCSWGQETDCRPPARQHALTNNNSYYNIDAYFARWYLKSNYVRQSSILETRRITQNLTVVDRSNGIEYSGNPRVCV